MKIAFWSNSNDLCNVTTNLAAISVTSVLRYPYSVITMENRLCSPNLGIGFFGHISKRLMDEEAGTNYYDGSGIEGLIRKIYRGEFHPGLLKTYVKDIISKHLFYIPQTRVIHSDIFDYEIDRYIQPMLNTLEAYADICMIDTASHQNLSTKTILEEVDLIVVNLCQSQSVLEDFVLNYSSIIPKAVFIISDYDFHTKLNYKRISAMYEIPLENIAIIPKNELYEEAFRDGRVVGFITRNYLCEKGSRNYIFMQALKKATYLIIKKAVELNKQKEIS